MASSATILLDRACPPAVTDHGGSALLASVPSGAKNVVRVTTIPFGNAATPPLRVPTVYTRVTPVYTDYTAYPVGTRIEKYTEDGAGAFTAFAIYYKVANAGAATDIKLVTIA